MSKLKDLKKKIRRLEARLQKGAKKLAKLKRRLGAAATVAAAKPKSKSAGPEEKHGKTSSASASTKKQRLVLRGQVKPTAAVKAPRVTKKVKRKLNLTPERRAQLAAAMKARWDAKRAAAAANRQNPGSNPGLLPGNASKPQ
jgi:chromosome segregation ATPase